MDEETGYSPPRCRRCLLAEIDRDGVYKTVREYLSSLGDDVKCSADDYAARLAVCRACDRLSDGMCALCGCFVEVRAAKRAQNCPDLPHRWDKIEK